MTTRDYYRYIIGIRPKTPLYIQRVDTMCKVMEINLNNTLTRKRIVSYKRIANLIKEYNIIWNRVVEYELNDWGEQSALKKDFFLEIYLSHLTPKIKDKVLKYL